MGCLSEDRFPVGSEGGVSMFGLSWGLDGGSELAGFASSAALVPAPLVFWSPSEFGVLGLRRRLAPGCFGFMPKLFPGGLVSPLSMRWAARVPMRVDRAPCAQ
jgi:hypothetical protein